MKRLTLVCGPAGAGKTTWASNELGNQPDYWTLIHTDSYVQFPRDARPSKCAADVLKHLVAGQNVILEGVEALRTVSKAGIMAHVSRVMWIDGPEKPGCAGLTTQQKLYLSKLHGWIPATQIVKRNV